MIDIWQVYQTIEIIINSYPRGPLLISTKQVLYKQGRIKFMGCPMQLNLVHKT